MKGFYVVIKYQLMACRSALGMRCLLSTIIFLASMFLYAPYAHAATNLVGYWKFDETSGNAVDSSGNNITLTNNGSVTYSTGTQGNAAVFNGSNFLSSSNGPNLANSSFTFSFWIKTTNIDSDRDFFGLGSVEDTNQALHLRVTPGGTSMRLGFYANDLDISANITTNEWHNILFIYDKDGALGYGTGYRTAYVDGVQKDQQTGVSAFVGNRNLTIGKSPFFTWVGQVDDFRIYNRGLTSAEIDTIASGGAGPGVGLDIESFSPVDNATNVSASITPSLTFGTTTVATSTGAIGLYKTSDNSLVESFTLNSSHLTRSATTASTTYTIQPTNTLAENTEYYFWVASTTFADGLGNKWGGTTASTTWSFTTGDFTAPTLSSISATSTASTTATITWSTNESASSKLTYGLTTSYGTNTSEADTSPRVTSHTSSVSGLLGCTTYHYVVVSRDAALNAATSSDATFTTIGCTASSTPSASNSATITSSSGGSTNLSSDGKTLTVSLPANATATSSSVVIQVQSTAKTPILQALGTPSALPNGVSSIVFDVKAIINGSTILDSFDHPVTITYAYTDADASGLNESTFKLYHYHNDSWQALDDCSVNTSSNTITCTTQSFSIFGLFGSPLSSSSSSSSSGGSAGLPWCSGPLAPGWNKSLQGGGCGKVFTTQTPVASSTRSLCQNYPFTRTLRFGMTGEDIRGLQKLLNCLGFTLGTSGPGSPGHETNLFVDRTYTAVKRFQETYAFDVLVPIKAGKGTGIFGFLSQKKAQTLTDQ